MMTDMKKNKKRILFIYSTLSSFVKNDLEILQKYYDVSTIKWRGEKDILKILKGVIKSDITYSWFASDHAFFAVLFSKFFRKKSIVIVGGFDVAYIPELNYGRFTSNWYRKKTTKYALKKADILLTVSNHTKNELLKRVKPKHQEIVYNGVDTERFKPKGEKEKVIVTIGNVTDQGVRLKGLETFAKVSAHFPDYKFVIIGPKQEVSVQQLKEISSNLIFTGKITNDEVLSWLQRAKIYCQLSYVESFGMGVAEAMSCECIPVVTNRGALPEVVGDYGYYTTYDDKNTTIETIKKALQSSPDFEKKARHKIINAFMIKVREEKLVKILNDFTLKKTREN